MAAYSAEFCGAAARRRARWVRHSIAHFVIEAAMSSIEQDEDTFVSPASHRFTTGSMHSSRGFAVAALEALRVAPVGPVKDVRTRSFATGAPGRKRFPTPAWLYFGCFGDPVGLEVSHRGDSGDVRCHTTGVLERKRRRQREVYGRALCWRACLPVRPVTVTSLIGSARSDRARLAAPASSDRARDAVPWSYIGPRRTLTPSGHGLR